MIPSDLTRNEQVYMKQIKSMKKCKTFIKGIYKYRRL